MAALDGSPWSPSAAVVSALGEQHRSPGTVVARLLMTRSGPPARPDVLEEALRHDHGALAEMVRTSKFTPAVLEEALVAASARDEAVMLPPHLDRITSHGTMLWVQYGKGAFSIVPHESPAVAITIKQMLRGREARVNPHSYIVGDARAVWDHGTNLAREVLLLAAKLKMMACTHAMRFEALAILRGGLVAPLCAYACKLIGDGSSALASACARLLDESLFPCDMAKMAFDAPAAVMKDVFRFMTDVPLTLWELLGAEEPGTGGKRKKAAESAPPASTTPTALAMRAITAVGNISGSVQDVFRNILTADWRLTAAILLAAWGEDRKRDWDGMFFGVVQMLYVLALWTNLLRYFREKTPREYGATRAALRVAERFPAFVTGMWVSSFATSVATPTGSSRATASVVIGALHLASSVDFRGFAEKGVLREGTGVFLVDVAFTLLWMVCYLCIACFMYAEDQIAAETARTANVTAAPEDMFRTIAGIVGGEASVALAPAPLNPGALDILGQALWLICYGIVDRLYVGSTDLVGPYIGKLAGIVGALLPAKEAEALPGETGMTATKISIDDLLANATESVRTDKTVMEILDATHLFEGAGPDEKEYAMQLVRAFPLWDKHIIGIARAVSNTVPGGAEARRSKFLALLSKNICAVNPETGLCVVDENEETVITIVNDLVAEIRASPNVDDKTKTSVYMQWENTKLEMTGVGAQKLSWVNIITPFLKRLWIDAAPALVRAKYQPPRIAVQAARFLPGIRNATIERIVQWSNTARTGSGTLVRAGAIEVLRLVQKQYIQYHQLVRASNESMRVAGLEHILDDDIGRVAAMIDTLEAQFVLETTSVGTIMAVLFGLGLAFQYGFGKYVARNPLNAAAVDAKPDLAIPPTREVTARTVSPSATRTPPAAPVLIDEKTLRANFDERDRELELAFEEFKRKHPLPSSAGQGAPSRQTRMTRLRKEKM